MTVAYNAEHAPTSRAQPTSPAPEPRTNTGAYGERCEMRCRISIICTNTSTAGTVSRGESQPSPLMATDASTAAPPCRRQDHLPPQTHPEPLALKVFLSVFLCVVFIAAFGMILNPGGHESLRNSRAVQETSLSTMNARPCEYPSGFLASKLREPVSHFCHMQQSRHSLIRKQLRTSVRQPVYHTRRRRSQW